MEATVIFSKIKDEIINNLKKSKKEIRAAVAWLTDEDIIRVLTKRSEEGVNVRIAISDRKENFVNTKKFKDYLLLQGELYISTNIFLHHKFCIIDNSIIINGSYNWSYMAKDSEENIMVISLDANNIDDNKMLEKFNVKHTYLCDKCSIQIRDFNTLNDFRTRSRDLPSLESVYDEREIILRQEFEADVEKSFNMARVLKIPVSPLLLEWMKAEGGGVEFVKRIIRDEINDGDMKSGFKKLEEFVPHRVDLSLEYLVSRSKYKPLFTSAEVEFCNKLMRKYGL